MSEPYIGEIRMFGGNFSPLNWAFCNGQLMSIAEDDALYSLIGTTYGGDGQTTFGLPNLQGRLPVHQGSQPGVGTSYVMGQPGGVEGVTLNTNQMPAHSHPVFANPVAGGQLGPAGHVLAGAAAVNRYEGVPPATPMSDATVGFAGSSQPHENRQPFLCVSFIICLYGIFPSQG
jgi:microcystin-dependent protein